MSFSPPEAFRRLHSDGRFDYWGAPYHSLTDDQRQELARTRLPSVLWWKTIEWDDSSSPSAVEAFPGDEDLRPDLIPFAGNGYGDRYSWYPPWQAGDDTPVVFITHDELESPLFARSFEECLVRCMLRHFADWEGEEDGDFATCRALWDAHLAILLPLLPAALAAVLTDVARSPSREVCEAADGSLERAIGRRTMVGTLLPTRYAEQHFHDRDDLLRCYDDSVAFYTELVEDEGRSEFGERSGKHEPVAHGLRR